MPKYRITRKAATDLSDIWQYTFEEWSEEQADLYYESIVRSFSIIADKPRLGKSYSRINDQLLGFAVNKHIVFYQIAADNVVEIIRILHQRMDLKYRLKD